MAEALRMSLPIVISKRFKELPDFVEHGVNGLIVDEDKYLDAIDYLLKKPKLLYTMSKESYKKYCKLYKSKPALDWYSLITNT